MHDPLKLSVEMWAVKRDGRTRIMISVPGDPDFEVFSYPSDLPEKMTNPKPLVIPAQDDK